MTAKPPTDLAWRTQFRMDFAGEINVDLFAGGGGASTGLEMALGRPVDVAINHDPDAISMHQANHPHAKHYLSDVYEVDPIDATEGRPVGHFHASPDCTHHSQAAGGQPRKRAVRSLSWVVHKWAGTVRPRVITLENVEQILHWSPLVAKRCKTTGRVITTDTVTCPKTGRKSHRVAEPGERVPVQQQFLVPDKRRRGHNWRHFVEGLRKLGYKVEWRTLRACDFGAPTTRERLFMVARCDGKPIVWPAPTHFKKPKRGQQRWRSAAECIDWTNPSRSIFDRPKPLADATMRRIAKGVQRYVLDAADPFIVPIANYGSGETVQPIGEPLRTITAWPKGGSFAVVAPTLVKFRFGHAGGRLDEPLPTITSGGGSKRPAGAAHAMGIATAYMAQMNGGYNTTPGHDMRSPTSTITNKGSQQQLVTAHLATLRRNCIGRAANEPVPTLTAGAEHHALVQCTLSPEHEAGALRVAAFLMHYYSTGGQWSDITQPMPTVTTRDRLALVTVIVKGTPYVIVDICLRMLQPPELYRAQGFPGRYIFDRGHDGRRFSKSAQVKMVGNSVSPLPMCALAAANHSDEMETLEVIAGGAA